MKTNLDLQAPLSDDELQRLDDILLSDATGEESMPVDELHGFLTAVVSASDMILPSEFLPEVWGDSCFATQDDAQECYVLIMRLYNDISRSLRAGEFEAIIMEDRPEIGDPIPIPEGWCAGYVRGMKLRPLSWQAHLEELSEWLVPIMAFGVIDDENPGAPPYPQTLDQHHALNERIPESALAIHDYFRNHAAPPPTPRRAEPKTGRNDPCPCGSGKKYKKCHGAADAPLH